MTTLQELNCENEDVAQVSFLNLVGIVVIKSWKRI